MPPGYSCSTVEPVAVLGLLASTSPRAGAGRWASACAEAEAETGPPVEALLATAAWYRARRSAVEEEVDAMWDPGGVLDVRHVGGSASASGPDTDARSGPAHLAE